MEWIPTSISLNELNQIIGRQYLFKIFYSEFNHNNNNHIYRAEKVIGDVDIISDMCRFTHIFFFHFSNQNDQKTLQNDQITSQIFLECVFTCFRYKGWKTDEKRAKYEELAESVPQLPENDRFGPWWNILGEKVKVDPWELTKCQI